MGLITIDWFITPTNVLIAESTCQFTVLQHVFIVGVGKLTSTHSRYLIAVG